MGKLASAARHRRQDSWEGSSKFVQKQDWYGMGLSETACLTLCERALRSLWWVTVHRTQDIADFGANSRNTAKAEVP